ncbi:MAG: hypothetical protein J7L38_05105 [Thermoproteales archaeon]|nr:hypothetical protein [Thermoproteales archaeon]
MRERMFEAFGLETSSRISGRRKLKEGRINTRKILAAISIISLVGVAVYFLSQDMQPPTIKIIEKSQQDKKLFLKARIRDQSGIDGAYILVKYPSGKTLNITLFSSDGVYSLLSPLNLSEEGVYYIQIFARDGKGNLGCMTTSFTLYDNPKIVNMSYLYVPNTLRFNVTAKDSTGISKVLLDGGSRITRKM